METLKVELIKLKKKKLIQIASLISIPSIIFALGLLNSIKDKTFNELMFDMILGMSAYMYIGLLLPIMIIYIVCMINKIETDNNGWKLIMSMPIKKEKIYLSKICIILIMLSISIAFYYIFCNLGSLFMGGDINLKIETIFKFLSIIILFIPVSLILFIVTRRVKKMIVTIGVGIVFMISTFLIAQSEFWIYIPWVYPLAISMNEMDLRKMLLMNLLSIFIVVLLFLVDCYKFKKQDLL